MIVALPLIPSAAARPRKHQPEAAADDEAKARIREAYETKLANPKQHPPTATKHG
jgi:hypothetical protein